MFPPWLLHRLIGSSSYFCWLQFVTSPPLSSEAVQKQVGRHPRGIHRTLFLFIYSSCLMNVRFQLRSCDTMSPLLLLKKLPVHPLTGNEVKLILAEIWTQWCHMVPLSADGCALWGLGTTARPKKSTSGCRTHKGGLSKSGSICPLEQGQWWWTINRLTRVFH